MSRNREFLFRAARHKINHYLKSLRSTGLQPIPARVTLSKLRAELEDMQRIDHGMEEFNVSPDELVVFEARYTDLEKRTAKCLEVLGAKGTSMELGRAILQVIATDNLIVSDRDLAKHQARYIPKAEITKIADNQANKGPWADHKPISLISR